MSEGVIETLVQQVRVITQRRVALELQWEFVEDDFDGTGWVLELHVLVELPGPLHSQYSSIRIDKFPAEELEQRHSAHAIAGSVAEIVQLPLHAPLPEERGGRSGSEWLRRQAAGKPVGYEVHWTTSWFTDDGRQHEDAGVERVEAESGDDACRELARRLARSPYRPLRILTKCEPSFDSRWEPAPQLPAFPSDEELHTIALDAACSASRIARALVEHVPAATALELMLAFEQAFGGWVLEAFTPVARWRAGEIADAALDVLITPKIEQRRRTWNRLRVLRELRATGQSIAAYIRAELRDGENHIEVVRALIDAFDARLSTAKVFADDVYSRRLFCSHNKNDAELDQSFFEEIARNPRGRTP